MASVLEENELLSFPHTTAGAVERFLLRARESMLVYLAQLKSDHPPSQGFITWVAFQVLPIKVSNGKLRKRKERGRRKAIPMLFCPSWPCERAEMYSSLHSTG